MSYDVTISLDDEATSPDAIREYFRGRRWYEVGDEGAEYADIDTGIGFEVDWEADGPVDRVTFAFREGRPRVYGREAAEELAAFADAFSSALDEEVDADEVRADWEASNRGVVESGGAEGRTQHLVDDERLEATWRWNRGRRDLMEQLGGSMFVPRILFFRDVEGLQRGVVWPDAIPLALPEVEFVLVSVPEHVDPSQDTSRAHRISYDQFVDAASSVAEHVDEPVPHLQLRWTEAPVEFIEELTSEHNVADPDNLTGLAIDSIFEGSLIQTD